MNLSDRFIEFSKYLFNLLFRVSSISFKSSFKSSFKTLISSFSIFSMLIFSLNLENSVLSVEKLSLLLETISSKYSEDTYTFKILSFILFPKILSIFSKSFSLTALLCAVKITLDFFKFCIASKNI